MAQYSGVANETGVILILIATGACVPFQLFMNECIAPGIQSGKASLPWRHVGLVLILQAIAVGWVVSMWNPVLVMDFYVPILILVLALNTFASYKASLIYLGLVIQGKVSMRLATLVGIMPGLISFFLYIVYCLIFTYYNKILVSVILLSTFVPSLVQWLFLNKLGNIDLKKHLVDMKIPSVSATWLLMVLASLAALAAISTNLREIIAKSSGEYIALWLVAINGFASLINTITRVSFLSNGGFKNYATLSTIMVIALVFTTLNYYLHWKTASLSALIVVQIAIVWIVEISRRVSVVNVTKKLQSSESVKYKAV
jgi:hypothetical protein